MCPVATPPPPRVRPGDLVDGPPAARRAELRTLAHGVRVVRPNDVVLDNVADVPARPPPPAPRRPHAGHTSGPSPAASVSSAQTTSYSTTSLTCPHSPHGPRAPASNLVSRPRRPLTPHPLPPPRAGRGAPLSGGA